MPNHPLYVLEGGPHFQQVRAVGMPVVVEVQIGHSRLLPDLLPTGLEVEYSASIKMPHDIVIGNDDPSTFPLLFEKCLSNFQGLESSGYYVVQSLDTVLCPGEVDCPAIPCKPDGLPLLVEDFLLAPCSTARRMASGR